MPELTYSEATLEALAEEMATDPTIFVVGEGVGFRGGNFNTTVGLHALYGDMRLRDTGICERGFTGLCAGAAMTGSRPIVDYMFLDFGLDAMGELLNQIAKIQYMSSGRLRMPIVLRACIGLGDAFATHHSGTYYSFFVNHPGFRVALPTTPADAKGLLKSAIRSDDPVLFLEHKSLLSTRGVVPDGEYTIPFGQAAVRVEGTDATVVALTTMVQKCVDLAAALSSEGVSVEVIDPRTIAPLDFGTIRASLRKTGRLLIVDESFGPCGIGAEIAARVVDEAFDDLDAPVRRLNGAHVPMPYSAPLEAAAIPQHDQIAGAVRDLLAE